MTAIPKNPRVNELRELFKNLLALRSCHEEAGLEEIETPSGNVWSLWDLEYLYEIVQDRMPLRQQQAFTLCLVHGMRERDAAVAMGVSETNPVMMYATLALQRLLDMIDAGELVRFVGPVPQARARFDRRVEALAGMVQHIEDSIIEIQKCLIYPTTCQGEAKILIRSPKSPLGYIATPPMQIMYEHYIGSIPPGFRLTHTLNPKAVSYDCVNPHHAVVVVTPERQRYLRVMEARYRESLGVNR